MMPQAIAALCAAPAVLLYRLAGCDVAHLLIGRSRHQGVHADGMNGAFN
jgi:hypothetical protein